VGVAAKVLWRKGGYHLLSFSQLVNVSQSTLTAMTGDYGMGFGADLGTQYVMNMGRMQLSLGAAVDNVGGIHFASIADPQPQAVAAGFGLRYSMSRFAMKLAYDYRNIFADADWKKKTHLGMALEIPVFTLYTGMSEMMWTAGFAFDLWLFRITAASYAEELAATSATDPERRYLLQVALRF
jgi:hypothetical protein